MATHNNNRPDFELVVGAAKTASYLNMKRTLKEVMKDLNDKANLKVKIDIDESSIKKIKDAVASLNKFALNYGKSNRGGRGSGSNTKKDTDDELATLRALIKGYNQLTQMQSKQASNKWADNDKASLNEYTNAVRALVDDLEQGKVGLDDFNKELLKQQELYAELKANAKDVGILPKEFTDQQKHQAIVNVYNKLAQIKSLLSGNWSDAGKNTLLGLQASFYGLLDKLNSGELKPDDYAEIFNNLTRDLAKFRAEAKRAEKPANSLSKILREFITLKGIVSTAKQVFNTMRRMAQTSIELDEAFTQLQIVTGATDNKMRHFAETTIQLSKDLGRSVTDMAKSIETFSRLGYNLEDASVLAKYASIMTNIAGVTQDTATKGITAIVKGFGLDIEDVEHVADVLVNVGQKYAVSAAEMMEAFEKSGAALHATNTTFEKSAGLIAAANASVQNASTVGTALKTVSARIRGAKSDLAELGEDTEEFAEGFSKYAKEIQAITGFSILVEGTQNTYKDLYDIMDGIHKVWKDLSDTQQARVSEILGGTRQLQVISSIIGNWGDAAGAYADAMDSAGVATKANNRYMESAQAHVDQLNAAYQELTLTVVNGDMVKQAVDLARHGLEILNEIAKIQEYLGGIKTLLIATSGVIVMLKASDIIEQWQRMVSLIREGITAFKTLSFTAKTASGVLATGAGVATLAITALVAAISICKKIEEDRLRQLEDAKEAYNELDVQSEKYKDRIYELKSAIDSGNISEEQATDARKELLEIQNQLLDNYGKEAYAIDIVGEKAEESARKIDRLRAAEAGKNLQIYAKEFESARAVMETSTSSRGITSDPYLLFNDNMLFLDDVDKAAKISESQYLYGRFADYMRQFQNQFPGLGIDSRGGPGEYIYTITGTPEERKRIYDAIIAGFQDFKRQLSFEGKDASLLDNFFDQFVSDADNVNKIIESSASDYQWYIDSLIASVESYRNAYDTVQEVSNKRNTLLTATFGTEEERAKAVEDYQNSLREATQVVNDTQYAEGQTGVKNYLLGQLKDLPETIGSIMDKASAVLRGSRNKLDFESLSQFKDAVSSLSSAWTDMFDKDGEKKLYSAIEDIHKSFSDVDGIDGYIERLIAAKDNANEFASVLDSLITVKVLDETESKLLAGVSDDLIAAMLKESGVANTTEVAIDILTVAKERMRLGSLDSVEAMDTFISGLENEAAYSDIARNALIKLAAQQIEANNVEMTFSNQIASLKRLAVMAGVAGESIKKNLAQLAMSKMPSPQYDAFGNITNINEMREYANSLASPTNFGLSGADVIQTYVDTIDKAIGAIHFDYSGLTRGKGGGGSNERDTAKEIEEYIVTIERYRAAIKRLNDEKAVQSKVDENIAHSNDLRDQIIMQRQLIDIYNEEQRALHNLNSLRRADITAGANKLRGYGFDVYYDPEKNDLWIANLEHINDLKGKDIEATNALRKELEETYNDITDLNEANKESSQEWWNMKYAIDAADEQIQTLLKDIVDRASKAVDSIQNVYDTLHKAADEYATSGFINVDTFQSVVSLGVEYLAYLKDENGQLIINEERIRNVIAQKVKQLSLDSALSYVDAIRIAREKGNADELDRLLTATEQVTDATWGYVYANLALIDLTDDQREAAIANINALRALGESAAMNIGKAGNAVVDELNAMKTGLDDLLKYVMEMLKRRVQDQIDAINQQKAAYSEIISQQKESLKNAKEEANTRKTMANKMKEIAKLQAQIDALSLDNSRSAQAKRAELMEKLAGLQEDLADQQNDYLIKQNDAALDEMEKSFHEEKDSEIDVLQDSISSTEKLYRMAMDYLENDIGNDYARLMQELIDWNYEVGNSFQTEIENAVNNAIKALERFGDSYSSAVAGVDSAINDSSSGFSGPNTVYDATYTNEEMARALVYRMKENSKRWFTATPDLQDALAQDNYRIATEELPQWIGGQVPYRKNGVWYLPGDRPLYDIYHSGGIVGNRPTLRQNETMAILENGEQVLTQEQERGLDRLVTMLSKIQGILPSLGGPGSVFGSMLSRPALGGLGGNYIQIGNVTVNAPVHVAQKLDKEELRKLSKDIGEISSEYIREGFTKHGIKPSVALI